MNPYELPTSLTVGGVEYPIRTDYRAILDILMAGSDPDLEDREKTMVMLGILYEHPETIPPEHLSEAVDAAAEFIDCGQKEDRSAPSPRLVDWEKDAPIIIPAVNRVAGREIRAEGHIHWWTFFSWYMEVGECLFSTVISIRGKRKRGEQLEKWEKEFVNRNRSLVYVEERLTEEEKAARDELNDWLNQ